jgi:hypothetical protein
MALLVPVEVAAQDRTFAPDPDILLGLKTDRSASLTFADLDGDDDLDVIVANGRHWTQPNEIFINNGDGRFTLGYTLGDELTTSYAVPAGDLDGDGDLDIVVGNDRAPNLIYLNDGHARFELAGNLDDVTDLTRGVYLSDLDGDTDLDVIVANRRAANTIYLNDGVGGFDRKKSFGTSEDSTIKMALGDLDGDGFPDIGVANSDGLNGIHLNLAVDSDPGSGEHGQ